MFRLCYLLFRSQAAKTGFDPKRANNLLRKFVWWWWWGEDVCLIWSPLLRSSKCCWLLFGVEKHLVPQQMLGRGKSSPCAAGLTSECWF